MFKNLKITHNLKRIGLSRHQEWSFASAIFFSSHILGINYVLSFYQKGEFLLIVHDNYFSPQQVVI